jgi:hypothetical protein
MRKLFVVAVVLVSLSADAFGQASNLPQSAGDFLPYLQVLTGTKERGTLDRQSLNYAAGYFNGLADSYRLAALIRPPEGADNRQMAAMTLKYIEDHPESHHIVMGMIALMAISEEWPGPVYPDWQRAIEEEVRKHE